MTILRSIRRSAARAAVAALLISGGVASSAAAVSWNSSTSPLTVTGYSSTGKGYGTWTVSTGTDGTRYRTGANLWMHNADNHKVYAVTENLANAGLCVAPDYTSCNQKFYYYNSSETAHYNIHRTWKLHTSSAAADARADFARGGIRVKLDVPWRVDPSSGQTPTKGVKY